MGGEMGGELVRHQGRSNPNTREGALNNAMLGASGRQRKAITVSHADHPTPRRQEGDMQTGIEGAVCFVKLFVLRVGRVVIQDTRPSRVRREWHDRGMARVRVSTTADERLLERARQLCSNQTDAALLDQALGALLAQHRTAAIDASYAAYDEHPLDERDNGGDLASFREAAAAS